MTDLNVEAVTKQVLNSQAEIQTALGFLRMELHPEYQSGPLNHNQRQWLEAVERRMAASLAMQHSLLADLGSPMYHPAQMPEGWTPA